MRLLNRSSGELLKGRCRATNLCEYCAKMAARETAEALAIDARETGGPQIWACLTTRSTISKPAAFYRAREKVTTALRRRYPDTQIATLIEFTTGMGRCAGGARRPHWNALIKGIDPSEIETVREIVARIWCQHVDAEPDYQHVGTIQEVGGLIRYLALHFLKESQAPPKGWSGHRFTTTRGYFGRGTQKAREAARETLRRRGERHKVRKQAEDQELGLDEDTIHEIAEKLVEKDEGIDWAVVRVPAARVDQGMKARLAGQGVFTNPRRKEATNG